MTELTGSASTPSSLDNVDITGITADSRQVKPGYLFAALRGTQQDGRAFAAQAIANGASVILTDNAAALPIDEATRRSLRIIEDQNPARRLAQLAARFHGRQPRIIAAVTGTNGKTSVAHFTRELWMALGMPAASLGTLGLVSPAGRRGGALTTPDPVSLHHDLAALAADGVEHVAIEASSHGLAQFRLDGLDVTAAAFTNLTRDHLDYHGDMAGYRAAKQRLFVDLLRPGGAAVLNADSPEYPGLAVLCQDRGYRVISYGSAPEAELRILARSPRPFGQDLALDIGGTKHKIELPLVGAFQAMNALAALGLVIATGSPNEAAIAALARLTGVPGRLQYVGHTRAGAPVFVDYAHTPDALATVLTALRPHTDQRLTVVFGAGGDRDRGKRPQMGEIAAALADRIYVTDDNPRSEDAASIRRAILDAVPGATEIGNRREAIAAAIDALATGDVLVIAGKGHETGQIVGGTILPFDDAVVAREVLQAAGGT
ncbi:MAG: UDP-N-acetylmuramoyl-L-alanyl-D-glutamate--2,6-diaminopimelate ligase [Alphaproteobacteria bacterium]|nr:UDP-N-acetylmuramoyl-L-alanyl-D-glutamate--2,6-diaminopimelate ligase [Alphaproteobacteria bacterium]